MAQNKYFDRAGIQKLAVPSGTVSGSPVAVGTIVGVAETDRDGSGNAMVNTNDGTVWSLSVKGVDGSGNSAVAIGDKIYLSSGDTPVLNKKTAGVLFGKALEAVSSGQTATIKVMLIQA